MTKVVDICLSGKVSMSGSQKTLLERRAHFASYAAQKFNQNVQTLQATRKK